MRDDDLGAVTMQKVIIQVAEAFQQDDGASRVTVV
jgi:hypothetical protein